MRYAYAASVVALAAALAASLPGGPGETMLENSAPHVGSERAAELGYTGRGVMVAVIDTGVDASHPDLAGRVSGGHNFVGGGEPSDTNGHGTQVAGIIAADGAASGVAPGATIVPYKVSEDGESVASETIARAISMASADGADIINISLGIPIRNSAIDAAVAEAVRGGAVVVVAAGNDGPGASTIGSPGSAPAALTVGATYNNVTSSLVSTLSAGQKQYEVAPMLGVGPTGGPITAPLADGGYGRPGDIGRDARGAILLLERGSDTDGELVYFAEKESNAADAGALAAVVYNNEPGAYLGDVTEGRSGEAHSPRIPILSMEREDGLELLESGGEAALDVFYNPDHVAFFSSRGPSSPFYIKPDMVAPGAFVNSTHAGGAYDLASGTSFAAPHVSGAAALLLEKHPGLPPSRIKAVLSATASPATDAYGEAFGPSEAGSGRLDAAAALGASLILEPAQLAMHAPPDGSGARAEVKISVIGGGPPPDSLDVRASGSDGLSINHQYSDGALRVRASGAGSGNLHVLHGGAEYVLPVSVTEAGGSVEARGGQGAVLVGVQEPDGWQYARVLAYDSQTGEASAASLLPGTHGAVQVPGPGLYWVEARIGAPDGTHYAYSEARVDEGPYAQWQVPSSAWLAAGAAAFAAAAGVRGAGRRRL